MMSEWKLVPVEPTEEMLLAVEGDSYTFATGDEEWIGCLSREMAEEIYTNMLEVAPQPPALGREPEEWCDKVHLLNVIQRAVAVNRMRTQTPTDVDAATAIYEAISEHLPIYEDVYDQVSAMIEPHVKRPFRQDGTLPASVVDSVRILLDERDTLMADLASAIADKEAYAQNAIDLRKQVDTLKGVVDRVIDIAEERKQGYANREHGAVLNGRCMDKVCALFGAAPAAKDGAPSTYVVESHMDDPKPMKDGE